MSVHFSLKNKALEFTNIVRVFKSKDISKSVRTLNVVCNFLKK